MAGKTGQSWNSAQAEALQEFTMAAVARLEEGYNNVKSVLDLIRSEDIIMDSEQKDSLVPLCDELDATYKAIAEKIERVKGVMAAVATELNISARTQVTSNEQVTEEQSSVTRNAEQATGSNA